MTKRAAPRSGRSPESPTKADLLARVAALTRELAEARDQQTATSEILRVISSSPGDARPVFDAITTSALRLLGGLGASLTSVVGDELHLVSLTDMDPSADDAIRSTFPMPVARLQLFSDMFADRGAVMIADVQTAPGIPAEMQQAAVRRGYRSLALVPLSRNGRTAGYLGVSRAEAGGFADAEIDLLKTFADQAVIALENVRLFTQLEARNADLSESLARQVATGEVLRAISRAQVDAQPVFDIIAASARRLCGASYGQVQLYDGEVIRLAALDNVDPAGAESIRRAYPLRVGEENLGGRVIGRRDVVQIPDVLADAAYRYKDTWEASGLRSLLGVPMLRYGAPIGAIAIGRREAGAFPDSQVELLQTFADQAVIAIENVRLFTELQASNRDLTDALDKQTATSEILRVISQSQTDVQPVFDAIIDNAVRLCGAVFGRVFRHDAGLISMAAHKNFPDDAGDFPRRPDEETLAGRVIRTARVLHSVDVEADPSVPTTGRAAFRARGVRSVLAVPMFREGQTIGVIIVGHADVGAFSDAHVELLRTFADQAVIAIENARLFTELQARTAELTRSVEELTALGDVGRALSSTLDLETVLQTIVVRANELAGTAGCTIWEYDAGREEFWLRASDYADEDDAAVLQPLGRLTAIPRGQGVNTRVMERRAPVQIEDITAEGAYESPIRQPLVAAGHRALLGVPLLSEDEVIGVLAVTRKTPGAFAPETERLLSTFATQSALAIQNARLFREIEDKSRQLEAASRHKSEFLANMSHELRTPLNAIIGFSEVLAEGMFGDINDKQTEYLHDILESGRHLLSLINDILDLSKIEAGRMELDPSEFDLPAAIDNTLTLVRERAGRRGITLGRAIDPRVGTVRADERKVKQVLLNLLSNALKFTPEGGRIDVSAAVDDGHVEVSVADTGVGIAPEDQGAIFEEFRQVGTASKTIEGTGLGLALSRKFIELHGGRIWVKSQVGAGSTFTFSLSLS